MKEYEQKIYNIIDNLKAEMRYQCDKVNEQAYKQGHKRGYAEGYEIGKQDGYEDGKADTPFTDTEEAEKKAYNKGLSDAWEVIKKITKDDSVGGYSIEMMQELFGQTCVYDITHNYTPEEVLAKIKEYEDKQKQDAEIKVGYEVYNLDRENKRIVTAIDGNKAIQLCSNGKYTVDNIDTLHWTGREDLRIKKVLENITNEV